MHVYENTQKNKCACLIPISVSIKETIFHLEAQYFA